MTTYIIRRIVQTVVVLILVSIIVFIAVRMLPGNPILMLVTPGELEEYTDQQIKALEHEFGIDRPMVVQYFDWISGLLLHGDLGDSIVNRSPVMEFLVKRLPVTFHIGILAIILAIIIGVPAGVICAVRRGKWQDSVVTLLANIGITAPNFWVGMLFIYFFGLYLKIPGYLVRHWIWGCLAFYLHRCILALSPFLNRR